VSTRYTEILKTNKDQKFIHSDVEEVCNSFRNLRFSDANLDFVKFVDTQIHKLIDFEFRHLPNKGDWRYMTAEDVFGYLLNECQPQSTSTDSSLEDRFRALPSKLFDMDYRDPKCFNTLFLEVGKAIMASASTSSSARIGTLCAILTDRLPRLLNASKKLFKHMKAGDFKPTQIEDWFARAHDLTRS